MASKERTPEQIRADIAASRHAMTVGIEGLVSEVHPTTLKNRAVDEAKQVVTDTKQMIYDTVDDTRTYFVDRGGVQHVGRHVGRVGRAQPGGQIGCGCGLFPAGDAPRRPPPELRR